MEAAARHLLRADALLLAAVDELEAAGLALADDPAARRLAGEARRRRLALLDLLDRRQPPRPRVGRLTPRGGAAGPLDLAPEDLAL